jgi:hypothetical protein
LAQWGMAFVYNNFLVADANNHRASVFKFYSDDDYEHTQYLQNSDGTIVDVAAAWFVDLKKQALLLDWDNSRVDVYDYKEYVGNPRFEFTESLFGYGSGLDCLYKSTSVCYDKSWNCQKDGERIYITDAGNKRVVSRSFITDSTKIINYVFPDNAFLTSADVDYFGNLYVVDKPNSRIYKFDNGGRPAGHFRING